MQEVTCHKVGEQRIAQALGDIEGRAFSRWHRLRYDTLSLAGLQEMCDELLDHVAARALEDPALADPARMVLRTAAECAYGVLDLGVFPHGDFEVVLPLVDMTLSSEDFDFGDAVDRIPTTRTWVDAFAMCLIGGLFREPSRVIAEMLRKDHAPELRTTEAESAGLAEMDALCGYLGTDPRPLRKPDAEERDLAARRLDAAGALTPDQRLLRVLLDDDQPAFEQALADRLVQHRESVGADPQPRSLLPVGTIALASLAVSAHGWQLGIRSGYIPCGLLRGPRQ
ncbi:immunity 49 family protein [Streptomyces olivoreticuli]|uniref:immunity 49 family protein n=1 Tax=Streptomyces olivoreticuli TaxID=68246 RepID=UPI002659D533|nr:immunity 49 family protein [Streptomyces olivoreticuli]WKK23483.1 immunity 49 family protein [Streptomyces olivoreticuli]